MKINAPDEVHRTHAATEAATTEKVEGDELVNFMRASTAAAVTLAPVITDAIDQNVIDPAHALVGLMLYTANFARMAQGTRQDFLNSAATAWDQSEEVFATSIHDVLAAARAKIVKSWCQDAQAMKWVKDTTVPLGRRLVSCHIKDPYASRWSLLGAIDSAADAESVRKLARQCVVQAIVASGFPVKPGSLEVTVINDYNDYGFAPPLPVLQLPEEPTWPTEGADEAKASYAKTVAEMKKNYTEVVVPQWPKEKADKRTKEQVLAVLADAQGLARRG